MSSNRAELEGLFKWCLRGAALCQILSGALTLLPWTRYLGASFAGYQAYVLDHLYDGRAGAVNLVASGLLALLSGLAFIDGSRKAILWFVVPALAWNVAFLILVIPIHVRLDILRSYGLLPTLCASGMTALLALTVLLRLGAGWLKGTRSDGDVA